MEFDEISANSVIRITHFSNPHNFYFKYEDNFAKKRGCKILNEIERKISEFLDVSEDRLDVSFGPDEIVTFYHENWSRFVRAQIESVVRDEIGTIYRLFLLDYGVFQQVRDKESLKKLPEEFSNFESMIHLGCLNLIPVKKNFNSDTLTLELTEDECWSETAIRISKKLIEGAVQIKFESKEVDTSTNIGVLYVKTQKSQTINLNQVLIDTEQAKVGSLDQNLDDSVSETSQNNSIAKVNGWQCYTEKNPKEPDLYENLKVFDDEKKQSSNASSANLIEYQDPRKSENPELEEISEMVKKYSIENDLDENPYEIEKRREIIPAGIYYRDRIQVVNDYGTGRKFRKGNKKLQPITPRNRSPIKKIFTFEFGEPPEIVEKPEESSIVEKSQESSSVAPKSNNAGMLLQNYMRKIKTLQNNAGKQKIDEIAVKNQEVEPEIDEIEDNLNREPASNLKLDSSLQDVKVSSTAEERNLKSKTSNFSKFLGKINSKLQENSAETPKTANQNSKESSETKIFESIPDDFFEKVNLMVDKTFEPSNPKLIPTRVAERLPLKTQFRESDVKEKTEGKASNKSQATVSVSKESIKSEVQQKNESSNYATVLKSNPVKFLKNSSLSSKVSQISKASKTNPVVNQVEADTEYHKPSASELKQNLKSRVIKKVEESQTKPPKVKQIVPVWAAKDNFDRDLEELEDILGVTFQTIPESKKIELVKAMRQKRGHIFEENHPVAPRKFIEMEESSVLKKQEIQRVLVHGISVPPIEKISESNLHRTVIEEMRKIKLQEVYRIQGYSWPNILSCSSIAYVNSRQTGKTVGYLPAICSMFLENIEGEDERNSSYGASMLVICNSSQDVEVVHEMICRLVSSYKTRKIDVVKALGSQNMQPFEIALLNGCDFFVTTPQCFSRIVNNKNFELFDKKKLKSIVIDDLDQIVLKCEDDLKNVFKHCCYLKKPEENPQIIVASNIWLPIIRAILKLTVAPVICVGNYVEAAVMVGCQMSLLLVEAEKKLMKLLEYINNETYRFQRTMIMARDKEEVLEMYEALKIHGIQAIVIHEETSLTDSEVAHTWAHQKPEFKSIAICSDQGLANSKIKSVQRLIHFSLPDSWTTFSFRFSACFDYYVNCLEQEELSDAARPSSKIFLDENNNQELPRLIDFLDIHKSCSISVDIRKLVKNIMLERDEALGDKVPLCQNLVNVGNCSDSFFCKDRHVLTKLDESGNDFPKDGMIKFQIIEVHSPKKYSVRVKEFLTDKKEGWQPFRPKLNTIEFFLQFGNYYNNPESQIVKDPIKINDLCAVEIKGETFRCKILRKIDPKSRTQSNIAMFEVRLIDTGAVKRVSSTSLWVMPENFKSFPATALDVYITDLIPFDLDVFWDSHSTRTVKSWIDYYKQEKCFEFVCSIALSVADQVFTSTIRVLELLPTINSDIIKESLKKRILKNKLCLEDVRVSDRLFDMAMNCGILKTTPGVPNDYECLIKLPHYEHQKEITSPVKSEGFFMKLSECVNYPIIMWDFKSPDNFLVQIEDKNNWQMLCRKIEDHAKRNLDFLKEPESGKYCLIKDRDTYNRGMVLEAQIGRIKCLWLDTGIEDFYESKDLFEIPESLIRCLPFQLVDCKLIGIQPKGSENWLESDVDGIYEKFIANSNDLYIRMMEEMPEREDEAEEKLLRPRKYSVLLIDCSTKQDVVLNRSIVDENLAKLDENTKHYLSIYVNVRENSEDSDDAEPENVGDNRNAIDLSEFEVNIPKESLVNLYEIPENSEFLKPLEIQEKVEGGEKIDKVLEESGLTLRENRISKKEPEAPEKILKKQNEKVKSSTEIPSKSEDKMQISNDSGIPVLNSFFHSPKIVWQQSESVIKLSIEARDCLDYTFDLDLSHLVIIIKYRDRYEVAVLNFFGCINPEWTSHEMTGITIYIRMLKKVMQKALWPRLLNHKDNRNWLIYNHEAYAKEKEEKQARDLLKKLDELREKYGGKQLKPDIDSDEECFIENNDFDRETDRFDPLEDDFL